MGSLDSATRRELGALLRQMRHREGLTLGALADLVGVSTSALSQFETGRSEPSLGTLWKLGGALNASLFDFFATRQSAAVDLTRGGERTVVDYGRFRYEAVARSDRRRLDLFFLHASPGHGHVRDPVVHAGEECGVVLRGTMDVVVGGDTYRLETGDGIWFLSTQPHTFVCVGDEECVSVWADTLPDHEPAHEEFEARVSQVLIDHTSRPDRAACSVSGRRKPG